MATQTLDTKGLNCPMPIVKAKKAMKGLNAGETLEVLATDPGAVRDFEALQTLFTYTYKASGFH